jgi:hypothetical protein
VAVELARLGPDTATEVALALVHDTVVDAGDVPVVGLTDIEPVTVAGDATATVTVWVAGPFGPCAVMV